MHKISLTIFLLVSYVIVVAQRYSDSTMIIGQGHIGRVTINMEESQLNHVFEPQMIKTEKKSSEGDEYSVIMITLKGDSKPSLELETMCMDVCVVSRIKLFSSQMQTVKKIGIGSTVAALKAAHGIASVVGGEKGIMIYTEDFDQLAFVVNVPKLKSTPGKVFEKTALPDDAIIEWIYMY